MYLAFGGLSCVSLGLTVVGSVQNDSIIVDDPRPLAEALRIFQARYGWIVTYEDPRYASQADVVDVTEAVRNPAAKPSGRRTIIPRGGPFSFGYQRPSPDSTLDRVAALVGTMVAEYNVSGYPGTFRVVRTDDMLHVVPASVQGRDGSPVPQSSILEARISLSPEKNRNTVDALVALLAAVRSATGQRVEIGTSPVNLLMQSRMEEGATDESARDVLVRTLRATGRRLGWLLLYDPGDQYYVLNPVLVD